MAALLCYIVSFLQLKFIYDYSISPAPFASGDRRAVNVKSVCLKEMVPLFCPRSVLKQAIQRGDYKELFWEVFDSRDKTQPKLHIGYCDENLNCTRCNSLGIYEKRMTIRGDLVMGVLHVEPLIENDLLTFVCHVERKRPLQVPVVYEVNISSIACKYDLNDYIIYTVSVLSVFSLSFLLTLLVSISFRVKVLRTRQWPVSGSQMVGMMPDA